MHYFMGTTGAEAWQQELLLVSKEQEIDGRQEQEGGRT